MYIYIGRGLGGVSLNGVSGAISSEDNGHGIYIYSYIYPHTYVSMEVGEEMSEFIAPLQDMAITDYYCADIL